METPDEKILYIGDNLPIMLGMESDMVDLIYTDPPFNTGTFRKGKTEKHSFTDTWSDYQVDYAHAIALKFQYPEVWELICLAGKMHSPAMQNYLEFMAPRLVQMHRVLKPTGSLYLHCDPNANYYLRILLDCIFGKGSFRNEIVWCYTGPSSPGMRQFGRKSDTIYWYSKGKQWTFNVDQVRLPYKESTLKNEGRQTGWTTGKPGSVAKFNPLGKFPENWWQIHVVAPASKERTGYDSQKPLELLNRVIVASSNPGDLVMDPFCGCSTTCVSAAGLSRRWIGIDQNEAAIRIFRDRLTGDLTTYNFETNKPVDAKLQKPIALPKRKVAGYKRLSKAKAKVILIQRDIKNGKVPFCRGCFDKPDEKFLEVDHILAEGKGGLDELENFQLLCGNCNKLKSDGDMEFLYRKLDQRAAQQRMEVLEPQGDWVAKATGVTNE